MTEVLEEAIQETMDYDVFRIHPGNRPIEEQHVRTMEEAIRKKNLLRTYPILVNKDFYIIDGQHRFEACKRNGWVVYFHISDDIELEDMKIINIAQKPWKIDQFVNYYANVEKIEDYMKLLDFSRKEDLKVNIALSILNNDRSSDFYSKVKTGNYEFPDEEEYKEALIRHENIKACIEYLKKTMPGTKTFLKNQTFYSSLLDFFNIKSFVYETFMKKLAMKLDLMRPCTTRGDFVRLFTLIYNWKNPTPIKSDYISEEI